MADRITRRDAARVKAYLTDALGPDGRPNDPWNFLTGDNWDVLVGMWNGTRGFAVSDALRSNRGYTSPRHDGGRYDGRGWHARMAADVCATIESRRAEIRSREQTAVAKIQALRGEEG